jgi:LacI family transcriptional regulator
MKRMEDVARQAQVSTATVSRVLNGAGFVSEELRQRVFAAAKEFNYAPNGIARSMAKGQTLTVGLVVGDITSPFFSHLARGVEDAVQANGYSLILCNADEDPTKEHAYLSILLEKRVDGILLAASNKDAGHVERLHESGVKLVLLDRVVPGLAVPAVQVENFGGIYQATEYLLALGHHRIAMAVGDLAISSARRRLDGFQAALEANGITLDPDLVVHAQPHQAGGYDAARQIMDLRPCPTAIISWSDVTTTGVLLALRDRGARIPEDISVVGFDDAPLLSLLACPLTVVAQPAYEVGLRASELLLRLIRDPAPLTDEESQILLPTQLITRASCGPARQGLEDSAVAAVEA